MSENGTLQFTLGLAAGNFLSTLGSATGGIEKFLALVVGGSITEGFFKKIEQGAGLVDLSKRTGETVSNLYKLQRGFAEAGLSTDDVGGALFQMQKSLGGVNEMGEKTADIFKRLGLSVADLKSGGGPEAMGKILGQLGQLNQADATKAASLIFGRGQAQNMLQLARSGDEFAAGMESAAAQAEIIGRNAERFEGLEKGWARLRENFSGVFLGFAEAVSPGLQALLDGLNGINFTAIGEAIGSVITVLANAFKDGSLPALIALGLEVGFGEAVNFLWRGLETIGSAFPALLMAGFKGFMATEAEGMAQIFARIPGMQGMAGNMHEAAQYFRALPGGDVGQALAEGWAGSSNLLDNSGAKKSLNELVGALLSTTVSEAAGEQVKGSLNLGASGGGSEGVKPAFTDLEKMGFVMGGLGNPMVEHARRTADNTAAMVGLLTQIAGNGVATSLDNI